MSQTTPRLVRSREPLGYLVGDRFVSGFPDDSELPDGFRRRIAHWCQSLTPELLSAEQQRLIENPPAARSKTPAHKEAEALGSFTASPYWGYLNAKERAFVLHPETHPKLDGASYPLNMGQLTALTGASADQLRHWHTAGLIPVTRTDGHHRRFSADAAMRTFAIRKLGTAELSVLRKLSAGRGGPMVAALATIFAEQARNRHSPQPITAADRQLLATTARRMRHQSAEREPSQH